MPFVQLLVNSPFLLLGFIVKYITFAKRGFGQDYRAGIKEGLKKASNHDEGSFSVSKSEALFFY